MYRLKIKIKGQWRFGLHSYTLQQVQERQYKMICAGVKPNNIRIAPEEELFN